MVHDAISFNPPQDEYFEYRVKLSSDDVAVSDELMDKWLLFFSIEIHESECIPWVIVITNEGSQCFPLYIMPWMVVGDENNAQFPTLTLDDRRSIHWTQLVEE